MNNGHAVVLRRAGSADALPAADLWLRSFTAALPTVRCAHNAAEVRDWFSHVLVPRYETWVAVDTDAAVVGLMVLNSGELKQLFLDPDWRGHGLGDRFVTLAKQRHPAGLSLWTFQVNAAARRFYERHGFIETEQTDGQRNDEREPDVRYIWQPSQATPAVDCRTALETVHQIGRPHK